MVKMQRNGILSSRLLSIKRLDQKSDLFYFAGAIYCKLTNAWPRKIKREDFYASGNSVAMRHRCRSAKEYRSFIGYTLYDDKSEER